MNEEAAEAQAERDAEEKHIRETTCDKCGGETSDKMAGDESYKRCGDCGNVDMS
jgi:hypothetical protein